MKGGGEWMLNTDVDKIVQISVVPAILELICKTTGMGFAAIARVTEAQWIACAVRDEIQFGLLPGGELKLDTTICHEIRLSGKGVVIDNVEADEFYRAHHTPLMYGFKSYISIPIINVSGDFFGTLCAIDPNTAILNTPEIIGMFKAYAALISLLMQQSVFEDSSIQQQIAKELQKQLGAVDEFQAANQGGDVTGNRRGEQFGRVIAGAAAGINALLANLQASN